METLVTDSDRLQAPPPLGDRPAFRGAGVAETFSTGAAVMLGVVGLELLPTFMAFLWDTRKTVLVLARPHHCGLSETCSLSTTIRELGFQ